MRTATSIRGWLPVRPTAAATTGHYASALNEVLLIGACIAFAAGTLALVLIRRKDFRAFGPAAPRPEPAAVS